jgi:hypothetical protein
MLEGDDIRRGLSELRSQREQFEYAFHGLLAGFIHRLEQGNPRLAAGPGHPQLGGGEPGDSAPDEQGSAAPAARPAAADATEVGPVQTHPPAQSPPVGGEPAGGFAPSPARASSAAGRPAASAEVDRDADIVDFSAALDRAPAVAPEWLREEQARPPEDDPWAPEPAAPVQPEAEGLAPRDAEGRQAPDEPA